MHLATAQSVAVSPAMQDYLKCCYRLGETGGVVSMSRLAEALDVAAPSVTNMVKRLEKLHLVRRDPAGAVVLTSRGQALALEVIRHHRLLETFLVNELGMEWAEAHREAEVLEHHISERLEALLDQRLAKPTSDPHGEPIPSVNGAMPARKPPSLLDHHVDDVIIIERVEAQDIALLQYLQDHDLVPGARVRIVDIAPFNGPIALDVNDHVHYVSRDVAACIAGVKKR